MNKKLLFAFAVFITLIQPASVSAKSYVPPTTKVQSAQCGQTLATLDTPILANLVAGAAAYRFRVTHMVPDVGISVQYVTSGLRTFKLTQLASYAFARSYTIDVAVLHGGVWQPYGPACTVTSPSPTTAIQSAYCGMPIASATSPIYASAVPFAQGYRFKVTNVVDPTEVHFIDRNLREFRLNLFDVTPGATYLVEVAVKNFDGNYLPYGAPCSITCPMLFTKIQTSFCGQTLGAFSDNIIADLVPGATGYRFRVTNLSNLSDVQILNRSTRSFSMSMLSNVLYNTAYRIEVALRDVHGQYQPYGPACTVFTSSLPYPKIQLSQCEVIGISPSELMFADDQPNATGYRFWLYDEFTNYSQVITRPVRSYSLSMLSGLQPNSTYTVKVAAKVNNVWTGYGKACTVTTPALVDASRVALQNKERSFLPKLYPNPYSDYFSIDASTAPDAEVSVRIYDMTGRLLEEKRATGSELQSLEIGQTLPPGVYNVILKHNEQTATLRAVRR